MSECRLGCLMSKRTYQKEDLDKNLEDEVEVVDDAEVLPIKNLIAH